MFDEVLSLARDVVYLREGVSTVDDSLVRLHVAVAPAGMWGCRLEAQGCRLEAYGCRLGRRVAGWMRKVAG